MNTLTLGRNCVAVALLAVLVTTLSPHSPVQAADDDVVDKLTPRKLERIMNSFNDVKRFKEVKENYYTFEIDGFKVILFNDGVALELLTVLDTKTTLTKLNEWNRKMRFSKAYLDKDGDVILAHSLDLTGGVTEENVKTFLASMVVLRPLLKKCYGSVGTGRTR